MKRAELLIVLLLATVAADMAALATAQGAMAQGKSFPQPEILVLFCLAGSQVTLLAVWVGLASKRKPWPVLSLVVGVSLWSCMIALSEDTSAWLEETKPVAFRCRVGVRASAMLLQALIVAGPLSVARSAGLRLQLVSPGDVPHEPDSGLRRRQFALGELLQWTTALAILLGLCSYMVRAVAPLVGPSGLPWSVWLSGAVLRTGNAALGLAALWGILGKARVWIRVLFVCLVTATVAAADSRWMAGFSSTAIHHATAYCVLQTLLVAGSLGVLGVAGYRLVWKRRSGTAAQP